MPPLNPEQRARQAIDAELTAAGWVIQDVREANTGAAQGVAIREFPVSLGMDHADYALWVDGKLVGVVEAKLEGATLTGVEVQSAGYAESVSEQLPAPFRPLPFVYESTGVETRFTNLLDPEPRSRPLFHFHRPEALAEWLKAAPEQTVPTAYDTPGPRPSTLRSRLRHLPPVDPAGLWPAQLRAVQNLEASLCQDRPRALIQMATGSGKTFTAITAAYRLIKHADATRVLFLVDRANLGRQALKEFQAYETPDDGRRFTELYNVQHLQSNRIDPVARVVIATVQRLYSILRGDPELDPTLEEGSQYDAGGGLVREPVAIAYNPAVPVETFDVAFIDECHRSIYSLWRQVVEYFDAALVGLTATPSKQTFGFFNQNLVMEYGHPQAVADGVNVDFDVYRIRTRITEEGARLEAGPYQVVARRERLTRKVRWETLDDDLAYDASALDREVVAPDQIRTVVRAFRDRLFTEIFPGRTHVPKTLIYAKDDSHADDIVQIVREGFGKGNDFAVKITYRTTGASTEDLIASFRNSYNPRIAVTVDMIATGTDVKPIEVVLFLRAVRSRNFFEQMKGRGVRVIRPDDLKAVTPDADAKTHFVIVDCVGVCERDLADSYSLEKKRTVAFEKLLQQVAFGTADPEVYSSLAGRLARLDRQLDAKQRQTLAEVAGGATVAGIAARLVAALDADGQAAAARREAGLPDDATPTDAQVAAAAASLLREAARPLATNPALRERLVDVRRRLEQTIDSLSQDEVKEAGFSAAARDRARALVDSFERYLAEHKAEITALQVLYSRPYARRLRHEDIRALAEALEAPPQSLTTEKLWRAYETLQRDRVRGASGQRLITDVVSLVRFALHQEDELVPFRERVEARYAAWLARHEASGRTFTPAEREWLDAIRDHVAASFRMDMDDFDYAPFAQKGGAGRATQVFGPELPRLLEELNEELVA